MWDKLEIPKPFSKCVHYVGEEFYLSKEVKMEDAIKIVKEKIHSAGYKAFEIYEKKYNKNSKTLEFNIRMRHHMLGRHIRQSFVMLLQDIKGY